MAYDFQIILRNGNRINMAADTTALRLIGRASFRFAGTFFDPMIQSSIYGTGLSSYYASNIQVECYGGDQTTGFISAGSGIGGAVGSEPVPEMWVPRAGVLEWSGIGAFSSTAFGYIYILG